MPSTAFNRAAFGDRLRALRAKKGLSQAELAELADLSDETVSRVERGAYDPSISSTVALARALGVSVDYLVGMADRNKRRNDTGSPAVSRLAARAEKLPAKAQRALLRLAELLPDE
jgi:transcriptional regulator with XRE-family HTH domain